MNRTDIGFPSFSIPCPIYGYIDLFLIFAIFLFIAAAFYDNIRIWFKYLNAVRLFASYKRKISIAGYLILISLIYESLILFGVINLAYFFGVKCTTERMVEWSQIVGVTRWMSLSLMILLAYSILTVFGNLLFVKINNSEPVRRISKKILIIGSASFLIVIVSILGLQLLVLVDPRYFV